MIIKIDSLLLDNLTTQAQASPRLRMNLDLRNSDGVVEASYELSAGGDARSESGMTERESCMMEVACTMNIPAGQWHTLRSLESGTVILEMKDGPFEPLQECDILK